MISIDTEKCTGCGTCVDACPTGAIQLVLGESGTYAEVDQEKCRHCEACLDACPEQAIMSQVEPAIEAEVVRAKGKPLTARTQPQVAPKTLLGAATAFVGREVLPRVTAALLDAWDRRARGEIYSPGDSRSAQAPRGPAANLPGRGGRQRRRRRHGGRW
jgi:Fe-S-cluster-containing hydrogenase component 2